MLFSDEHYAHIEALIEEYKKGSSEQISHEIIDQFRPLIDKYLRIIKDGKINLRDRDSRSFISLFISDPAIRGSLLRGDMPPEVKAAAYRAVSSLVNSCTSLSREDCMQDLISVLLSIATKYEQQNKGFCSYLISSFKFGVANKIKKYISDPVNNASGIAFLHEATRLQDYPFASYQMIDDTSPPLDKSWIDGVTCSDVFLVLSPQERELIKLSYYDGLTDIEVAKRLGLHRNWVREKKRRAIRKLEVAAYEEHTLRKMWQGDDLQDKASEAMPRVQRNPKEEESQT